MRRRAALAIGRVGLAVGVAPLTATLARSRSRGARDGGVRAWSARRSVGRAGAGHRARRCVADGPRPCRRGARPDRRPAGRRGRRPQRRRADRPDGCRVRALRRRPGHGAGRRVVAGGARGGSLPPRRSTRWCGCMPTSRWRRPCSTDGRPVTSWWPVAYALAADRRSAGGGAVAAAARRPGPVHGGVRGARAGHPQVGSGGGSTDGARRPDRDADRGAGVGDSGAGRNRRPRRRSAAGQTADGRLGRPEPDARARDGARRAQVARGAQHGAGPDVGSLADDAGRRAAGGGVDRSGELRARAVGDGRRPALDRPGGARRGARRRCRRRPRSAGCTRCCTTTTSG